MDPVTAFQVGAAAIAFVDFARNLVSATCRVYKSPDGRPTSTVRLSQISEHLRFVKGKIEEGVSRVPPTDGNEDHELLRLCQECGRIGADLESTVARLTASGTSKLDFAKNSFVVAARSLWRRGQLEALDTELDRIRNQVVTVLVLSTWQDVKVVDRSCERVGQRLDEIIKQLGNTEQSIVQEIPKIREDGRSTWGKRKDHGLFRDGELLAIGLWHSDWQPVLEDGVLPSESWIDNAILSSLKFHGMDDRSAMVPAAYSETFKWIFDEGSRGCGFTTWLQTKKSDVFWITGKPGSGKSTLMKYITAVSGVKLDSHLATWAGGQPPLWGGYYFWDAGNNPLQKSEEGMMRTLLHQCLQKRPDLLPIVTGRRYAWYSAFGNHFFEAPTWDHLELRDTLLRLAAESGKSFRLALFVDGLDEFSGDRPSLISAIKALNAANEIKVCVSSRPWTEFADALGQSPSLAMQTLTQADILAFIRNQLEACPGFLERKATSPKAAERLVREIAQGADGVFLWVSIVVRCSVGLLTAGKTMPEVLSFVLSLTPDMSELYAKIWSTVEPEWMDTSSRLFQLKIATMGIVRLDARLLWLSEEGSLPNELDSHHMRGGGSRLGGRVLPILRRKLDMHTRGILEVSPSGSIELLHRSAKDWLLQSSVWGTILSKTPPEYDPYLALLKAVSAYISPESVERLAVSRTFWGWIIIFLTLASNVPDRVEVVPELIASLDRVNSTLSADEAWTPASTPSTVGNVETCFVGLAAQFGILPYVREKV
ncbi:hypothetical protein B0T16DRAFT_347197, partial [Cercophora newfieldiana]